MRASYAATLAPFSSESLQVSPVWNAQGRRCRSRASPSVATWFGTLRAASACPASQSQPNTARSEDQSHAAEGDEPPQRSGQGPGDAQDEQSKSESELCRSLTLLTNRMRRLSADSRPP